MASRQDEGALLVTVDIERDGINLNDGLLERDRTPLVGNDPSVARFHGFDPSGQPLISVGQGSGNSVVATRSTVALRGVQMGAAVVVLFEQGDPRQPIVIGVLNDQHSPLAVEQAPAMSFGVKVDDERLVLTADREIKLRCDTGVGTQEGRSSNDAAQPGVATGVLVGFRDQDRTPLVMFAGQIGTAAVPARTTQDLHAAHIGWPVVLLFERADARLPIIVGSIKRADGRSLPDHVGHAEVEADGERLIVSAREQLVLQCGKASVTLTKAGKVLIKGTYVSTYSSGANRIKGGSVQIN